MAPEDQDKVKINWLTLSFPDQLEKDYQHNYIHSSMRQVRIALVLGMLLYGLFGLLDAWVLPEAKLKLWFIRFVCVIPIGVLGLIFTYSRHFEKVMQPIMASIVALAGIGIVAMTVIASPKADQNYYAGLILTLIYGYTFTRLRFVWASVAGWTIVVSYEIAAIFLSGTSVVVLISNNFFFLGSNILLMFACYSSEYHSRRDYLQTRMLESEKRKVEDGNTALEFRTRELEIARDRAVSASLAKTEFLANMSHELRTPLNHIIGFTEMVADKRFGDLNQVQQEYLGDVLESSSHLLSLINDILDLSKVEAGKMGLELSEISIPTLLDESLMMVREKAIRKGLALEVEDTEIPEMIMADERKLKQVMVNLLSNAVKFTPDGGRVRLTAKLVGRSEVLSRCGFRFKDGIEALGSSEKWLCVSVSDTGIGIKREDQERIFAPFEQVENSASRMYHGTGLGLSLTSRFVELHRGRIRLESEGRGKGSKFTFVIPKDQPKTQNVKP